MNQLLLLPRPFLKLIFIWYLFVVFTTMQINVNAHNSDHLEIILQFDTTISWDSCNLVCLTVNETGDTIYMLPVNQKIITNDSWTENNPADAGQRSCLYQQRSTNITRIVAMSIHNDTLTGFLSFKNVSYSVNKVSLVHEAQQIISMFIWNNFNSTSNETNKCGINANSFENLTIFNEFFFSKQQLPATLASASVNLNYVNNTMDNYYVELYLVADRYFYMTYGGNSVNYLYEIINYVNAVYRAQGVHILVVGVEVWWDYDRIGITSNYYQQIYNLMIWRSELTTPHDNLHMINRYGYLDGVVGLALVNGMCRFEYSVAMSADYKSPNVISTAMIVAHEMGHNFGLSHDTTYCTCPDATCIMHAYTSKSSNPLRWSDCSLATLHENLKSKSSSFCLEDIPTTITTSPVGKACGNGIVDNGEDCDLGLDVTSSPCCNVNTCKFLSNAVCASGQCCDKATCQFLTADVTCRVGKDECDLTEKCTGKSEICPDDTTKGNGEFCDNNQGTCYNGHCGSHNKQCKLLYGPSSSKASDDCYQLNADGIPSLEKGYCEYKFSSMSTSGYKYLLTVCSAKDYLCGALHCTKGSGPVWATVKTLSGNYTYTTQTNTVCNHLQINPYPSGLRDPGLVPNGAICGQSKICKNSLCVNSAVDNNPSQVNGSMLIKINCILHWMTILIVLLFVYIKLEH